MISVEYPAAFQAFTRNFSWVFGLIYIQPVEDNVLRKALSSGGLNEPKEDAISLTNAINALTNGISNAVGNAQVASGAYTLEDVQSSTADSARAGIEQFAERIGLSPATLFITYVSLVLYRLVTDNCIRIQIINRLPHPRGYNACSRSAHWRHRNARRIPAKEETRLIFRYAHPQTLDRFCCSECSEMGYGHLLPFGLAGCFHLPLRGYRRCKSLLCSN